MKLWFNITTSAHWSGAPVGIVRVELELYKSFRKLFPDVGACVWDNQKNDFVAHSAQFATNFDPLWYAVSGDGKKLKDGQRPCMGDIIISVGLDWDYPYWDQWFYLKKTKGYKFVNMVHDVIPVLFPQYCVGDTVTRFLDYFTSVAWGSDLLIYNSECTSNDVSKLLGSIGVPTPPGSVFRLGSSSIAEDSTFDITKDRLSWLSGKNYILYVSTVERRKNHDILYKAYHMIASDYKPTENVPLLIIAGGRGWGVDELYSDIQKDPLVSDLIFFADRVSDSQLSWLYKNCLFTVFPSVYEGWGIPVDESLSFGKPVICSDQGSLKEVGGEFCLYLSPWNAYAWKDEILDLSSDKNRLHLLYENIAKNYKPSKWDDAAKTVYSAIRDNVVNDARLTLSPGHDLSTESGIHLGRYVYGDSGLLTFGPYVNLGPGIYVLSVMYYCLELDESLNNNLHILIESHHLPIFFQDVSIACCGASHIDIIFPVAKLTEHIEFKAFVKGACVRLDEIRLSPTEAL